MGVVIDFEEKANQLEDKIFECTKCSCVVFFIYEDSIVECGRCNEKYSNPESLDLFIRKWTQKVEKDKSKSAKVIPIR